MWARGGGGVLVVVEGAPGEKTARRECICMRRLCDALYRHFILEIEIEAGVVSGKKVR